MKLRSIELVLPDVSRTVEFFTNVWGLQVAACMPTATYLRGSGEFPYLVGLEEGARSSVRHVTFTCSKADLHALKLRVASSDLRATECTANDPGGGFGLIVELPEGELLRFLCDTTEVAPVYEPDAPVKLTHVVLNSRDAEATANVTENILGFRVSDRTRGMVFVRCNRAHHSTAFARAGFSSLNHIAFEMQDVDAVMRGIGRLRDYGMVPSWGPGRHGPGANVFAYFIAPFGAVVEFSTAVNQLPDDYPVGSPADWTWPANRIDQWGMSDKDVTALTAAERAFCFERDWLPTLGRLGTGESR